MKDFNDLKEESQVIFLLSLSELVLNKVSEFEEKKMLEKVINSSWGWLLNKDIEADALYFLLENLDETGVLNYMMLKDFNSKNHEIFSCIANALAYTAYKAYVFEGEKYLPQTIESVDCDTIIEFIENFNKIYNKPMLMHEFVSYLLKVRELDTVDTIEGARLFLSQILSK